LYDAVSQKGTQGLPSFTNFYDYDFRNLQAYELLEDLFWESTVPSTNHLDFLGTKGDWLKGQDQPASSFFREPLFYGDNFSKTGLNTRNGRATARQLAAQPLTFVPTITLDDLPLNPRNVTTDFLPRQITAAPLGLQEEGYGDWKTNQLTLAPTLAHTLMDNSSTHLVASAENHLNSFRPNFEDLAILGSLR